MKIATWNVNSLKVRLDQLITWAQQTQPDIICLQELKIENVNFPIDAIEKAGYLSIFNGQKTYNGVAILSRKPLDNVTYNLPHFEDDQRRIIAATFGDIQVISAYFPNGQSLDSDKFQYKLEWIDALHQWITVQLSKYPKLILTGDFNIAPHKQDVHPDWKGDILCSPVEQKAFSQLLELGLVDSYRLFSQDENQYSWWDYRMNAFRRNLGVRIDHILVSKALQTSCTQCTIDKSLRALERPSDHCPVILELQSTL